MRLILLTQVFATLFMVGLIWFVQIVHYPHGAVMPLIIALRRQAPQWRRRDHDFLSGDDHRSMGASPIVAEPRLDNTQATGNHCEANFA